MCQAFDVIGARQRIDHVGHAGLVLQNELGVTGDAGGKLGRQGNRLIKRVGVQRLRAAQHCAHRLIGCADDIVVGVLLLQADAGGLAVSAQHRGLRFLRVELGHDAVPEQACGTQFGSFHEEIHTDGEEEGQSRREGVHIHAAGKGGFDVFLTVCERKGQLLHQRRASLLHVIAGDRY